MGDHEQALADFLSAADGVVSATVALSRAQTTRDRAVETLAPYWAYSNSLPAGMSYAEGVALADRAGAALRHLAGGAITRTEYDTERAAVLAEWARFRVQGEAE